MMADNNINKILEHVSKNDLYRIIEILIHMYIVYKKNNEYLSLLADIQDLYIKPNSEDLIDKDLTYEIDKDEYKYVLDPVLDLLDNVNSSQDLYCNEIIKDLLKNNNVTFDISDIEK